MCYQKQAIELGGKEEWLQYNEANTEVQLH